MPVYEVEFKFRVEADISAEKAIDAAQTYIRAYEVKPLSTYVVKISGEYVRKEGEEKGNYEKIEVQVSQTEQTVKRVV